MTHYTPTTVPTTYGPNPMAAFAAVANVGDTFTTGGLVITVTAREPHGPFTAVTFTTGADSWTTDYPF